MKKWFVGAGLIVVLIGGYVGAAHFSGGAFPTPGLDLGGERGHLRRLSQSFIEDVQFKDFDKAGSYHSPEDVGTVDIPYLLERMFLLKPEALEIMSYEVIFADLDSSGERGRVKLRVKVRDLVKDNVRDQEFILYYHRDAPGPWYMKLESSLRKVGACCLDILQNTINNS